MIANAETIAAFESSLERVNAEVTRVARPDASAALESLVEEPAVGVPLPLDGVSLPAGVETELTPARLEVARTGITSAAFGVADYGSVVLRADSAGTEPASLFPERHVAVLDAADVLPNMAAAFERFGPLLREERGSAIIATGPSATADMGALVLGAHGPKEVHVVVVGGERSDGGGEA